MATQSPKKSIWKAKEDRYADTASSKAKTAATSKKLSASGSENKKW